MKEPFHFETNQWNIVYCDPHNVRLEYKRNAYINADLGGAYVQYHKNIQIFKKTNI